MKLRKVVNEALLTMSREALAAEAGVSLSTVAGVVHGRIPMPKIAYRLAKACRCDDEDALKIAEECSSLRTEKTA